MTIKDNASPGPWRAFVFGMLESTRRADLHSVIFRRTMIALTLLNVALAMLETVPWVGAAHGGIILALNWTCVGAFLADYLCRLWIAPDHAVFHLTGNTHARALYAGTPLMIIDLLTLAALVLRLLFPGSLDILRIAPFFRLARYSPALLIIGQVFATERRALFGSGVLFIGLLLLTASLMNAAEGHLQPDKLGDVPSAMWWAIVTLSTVGYGDVTPLTVPGKVIAGMTMILGILFLALPVGIIASGFQDEIRRRDFVVSFGMVAHVPLFKKLDVATIAQLVGVLRARKVAASSIIVREGEDADAMYFIATGKVEVELPGKKIPLTEGAFFGEIALLAENTKRTATIMATAPTELLVLEANDFHRILNRNPALADAMREVAERRLAENRLTRDRTTPEA